MRKVSKNMCEYNCEYVEKPNRDLSNISWSYIQGLVASPGTILTSQDFQKNPKIIEKHSKIAILASYAISRKCVTSDNFVSIFVSIYKKYSQGKMNVTHEQGSPERSPRF